MYGAKRSRIAAAVKTTAAINLKGEAIMAFGRHVYLAAREVMNLLKIASKIHVDVCMVNGVMNFVCCSSIAQANFQPFSAVGPWNTSQLVPRSPTCSSGAHGWSNVIIGSDPDSSLQACYN